MARPPRPPSKPSPAPPPLPARSSTPPRPWHLPWIEPCRPVRTGLPTPRSWPCSPLTPSMPECRPTWNSPRARRPPPRPSTGPWSSPRAMPRFCPSGPPTTRTSRATCSTSEHPGVGSEDDTRRLRRSRRSRHAPGGHVRGRRGRTRFAVPSRTVPIGSPEAESTTLELGFMSRTWSESLSLGEMIRRQREIAALPMRQLAAMAGISNPYLSQIERGLRDPSDQVLNAIADSLQLSADSLRPPVPDPDPDAAPPAVVAAVRADPDLTAQQRKALEESYLAFREVTIERRRVKGRRNGGSSSDTPIASVDIRSTS